jgi:MFS family permease
MRAAERVEPIDPEELPRLRQRALWTLFTVSALGSTGYIASITVGTIAAAEISGTAAWGGVPITATTIGTALAASLLGVLMVRIGRRRGVLLGLGIGAVGGVASVLAILAGSIAVLLFASALVGVANGTSQLGRYIAADLFATDRRASAISTVVWGTTIGAVAGPNLIAPAGAWAGAMGLPELAGAYGMTMLFIGLAAVVAFVFLRPEPYAIAIPAEPGSVAAVEPRRSNARVMAGPTVLAAALTLVAAQVAMVLIMTMTPLHLLDHGHGLATVGFVLSAHMFGMFALSPISGRLADRFGSPRVIAAGLILLGGAALLAAAAPPEGGLWLTVALFLLGYGWNLCFVAGSALLTSDLALAERGRIQGLTDGLTWGTAAFASLAAGVIVAGASFSVLALLAGGVLVAPIVALLLARRKAVTATA